MSVCGLHHWSAVGVDCPQCVGASGGRNGVYAGDPAYAPAYYRQWPADRVTHWRNPAPDAAAPGWIPNQVGGTFTITAADRYPPQRDLSECLEVCARAIAANKRGKKPNDPEIDRIWNSYRGQAKACILAFLEESAQRQKAEAQPKPRYVPRPRGLTTRP